MSTVGVFLTAISVGVFVHLISPFTLLEGLLLGAIVSSTDAAAVFSILRTKSIGLKGNLRPLLELESGSNDPMAYFLTIGLTSLLSIPDFTLTNLIPVFFMQMLVGGLGGYLLGRVVVWIVNKINLEYEGLYPVLMLGMVVMVYTLIDIAGGNAFLGVYIAAITIGNAKMVHKKSLLKFFDGVAWLMQIVMFLILGLQVFPSELVPVVGTGLLLSVILMGLARPIAVFACLSLSSFTFRERLLVSWVGLRGAVPIIRYLADRGARIDVVNAKGWSPVYAADGVEYTPNILKRYPEAAALLRQLMVGEIDSYELEKRVVRKDGGVVWVRCMSAVVRDEDGAPLERGAMVTAVLSHLPADYDLRIDGPSSAPLRFSPLRFSPLRFSPIEDPGLSNDPEGQVIEPDLFDDPPESIRILLQQEDDLAVLDRHLERAGVEVLADLLDGATDVHEADGVLLPDLREHDEPHVLRHLDELDPPLRRRVGHDVDAHLDRVHADLPDGLEEPRGLTLDLGDLGGGRALVARDPAPGDPREEHQRAQAGPREVERGRQPVVSAADHDDVVFHADNSICGPPDLSRQRRDAENAEMQRCRGVLHRWARHQSL